MCAVSHMGDYWRDRVREDYPYHEGWFTEKKTGPTKEEFDKLKKEMKELKKMLKAAKIYDEKTGQKDCEIQDKVELIKKFAELVGVNMDEIFK